MSDLEEVSAFRNRFVEFANYVTASYQANPYSYSGGPDDAAMAHIRAEQVALTQEYGRLRDVIASHAGGIPQMQIPAVGIVSQNIILDAINRVGWHNWGDAAEMTRQHLDVAIGQMQARPRRVARPARSSSGISARFIGLVLAGVVFIATGLLTGVLEDVGRSIWRAILGS